MKLQHLAIIFVIIILPVSLVISSYIQTQINTITLQTNYSSILQNATYDAVKAFELNTINNKYSTVSDSKIRDIEASISTFYTSLGTSMGASGYDQETLKQFIPAMVYTMYDGYYIYGKYYNYSEGQYQYGLRPYIYYSCRYIKGNDDFIVNYTLDSNITVYGNINGKYITKSGTLINPSAVTNIQKDSNGNYVSLDYDGVTIEREILKQQLIILDDYNNPSKSEYEYIIYENQKVYKDGNNYFWHNNNKKQYITDSGTLNYARSMTLNGHLYSNSAVEYYASAYEFSNWVTTNIATITQKNAVDNDGKQITDFATNTEDERIFNLNERNNPLISGTAFNENRISVIRKTIQSNLLSAIGNYNSGSANTYEFVLPVFTEEDWDKVLNNISVITFMQGIPIGSKYFNNYCIITNNTNKEVVKENSIYVIDSEGETHLPGCKTIIDNNKTIVSAYKNTDFERQTVVISEENEVYYYPHPNNKCYECMVNISDAYAIDDVINGEIIVFNKNEENYQKINIKSTALRKIYLTALGRERYDLYKTNSYFGT